MKQLSETILDIGELEKNVDEQVRHSVVDYIEKSYINAGAAAATEWPLLWLDADADELGVDFGSWAVFGCNDKEQVSAAMNNIFGKVYYDDVEGRFIWSKTEKEIKANIIKWITPHLNDMGKHMIRKYKPVADYYMCDHLHKLVRVRNEHLPFNNAHIEVLMNNTVLFCFIFNFKPTRELQG